MECDAQCPYCGEPATVWVDTSGARLQRYVEDCAVCCRPWQVEASVDHDGEAFVILARLDS